MMLLDYGVKQKKIADILGIAPTNITKFVSYGVPIASRHERVLDDYMIEFQNELLKSIKGEPYER